jgi:hypothetical protein
MRIVLAIATVFVMARADGVAAQVTGSAWFPAESYFRVATAAPREPRFSGNLISTDLMSAPRVVPGSQPDAPPASGSDRTTQIEVGLGGTLRLWRATAWDGGGVIVGVQTGVFGRFDMETSATALIASDWLVAVPIEVARGRWSGRARFVHWSAHLGDEFIRDTEAERLDFTLEAIDLLAAYDTGPVRVYGGGARVLRSQLADASERPAGFSDTGTLQLGADGGWYPWANGDAGLYGGLDLQWSDRTEWRRQVSALAAFEARKRERALRVGLTWLAGPSPVGQFFLNEESCWGVEIRIDL